MTAGQQAAVKIRYRRDAATPGVADYTVQTQARRRARWVTAGMVSRFGPRTWAALGAAAAAWTAYRPTRDAAVRDMLAGRTFLTGSRPGQAAACPPAREPAGSPGRITGGNRWTCAAS